MYPLCINSISIKNYFVLDYIILFLIDWYNSKSRNKTLKQFLVKIA